MTTHIHAGYGVDEALMGEEERIVIEEERIVPEDFRGRDYLCFAVLPACDRRNELGGK